MKFSLATKEGAHVADVDVPPFATGPDVLIWGDRVFTFHQALSNVDDAASAEYREASAFYVPIPLGDRAESPAFNRDRVKEPTKE